MDNRAQPDPEVTRRGALGRLGGLLALGLWPGAAGRAATPSGRASAAGRIRFVVTNDFHHVDAGCDAWFAALFARVARTEGAAFCLGLGDLADRGKRESLAAIARLAAEAGVRFHASPGNHDLDESPVEGFYAEVFPGQRNYTVREAGWQVLLIDTTEGAKWQEVQIPASTLAWLDETLPTLNPRAPTVLATHFPLAAEVRMCPLNAEAVLERFVGFNLRGVFGGHYHARTVRTRGEMELVTNVGVSRVRENHDGTTGKGYWLVDGATDGTLQRTWVAWAG